jgi:single-strand DNA-binding protein
MVGRVAVDPELVYTPQGVAVCRFRVAVRDPFRKLDDGRYHTDFFDVKAWRQTGEYAANHLVKGNQVAIQGRVSLDEWTTDDGQKRRSCYVTADNIDNLGRPAPENGARIAPPAAAQTASQSGDADSHDPFAEG